MMKAPLRPGTRYLLTYLSVLAPWVDVCLPAWVVVGLCLGSGSLLSLVVYLSSGPAQARQGVRSRVLAAARASRIRRRECRHHDEDTHRRLRHAQLCGFAKANGVETNGHSLEPTRRHRRA